MAKNKSSFSGMADGLFSAEPPQGTNIESTQGEEKVVTETRKEYRQKVKVVGRPRASDLSPGEEVLKTSIYLTEETAILIDIYAAKNRMDRSEAIRKMIREYTRKDYE